MNAAWKKVCLVILSVFIFVSLGITVASESAYSRGSASTSSDKSTPSSGYSSGSVKSTTVAPSTSGLGSKPASDTSTPSSGSSFSKVNQSASSAAPKVSSMPLIGGMLLGIIILALGIWAYRKYKKKS